MDPKECIYCNKGMCILHLDGKPAFECKSVCDHFVTPENRAVEKLEELIRNGDSEAIGLAKKHRGEDYIRKVTTNPKEKIKDLIRQGKPVSPQPVFGVGKYDLTCILCKNIFLCEDCYTEHNQKAGLELRKSCSDYKDGSCQNPFGDIPGLDCKGICKHFTTDVNDCFYRVKEPKPLKNEVIVDPLPNCCTLYQDCIKCLNTCAFYSKEQRNFFFRFQNEDSSYKEFYTKNLEYLFNDLSNEDHFWGKHFSIETIENEKGRHFLITGYDEEINPTEKMDLDEMIDYDKKQSKIMKSMGQFEHSKNYQQRAEWLKELQRRRGEVCILPSLNSVEEMVEYYEKQANEKQIADEPIGAQLDQKTVELLTELKERREEEENIKETYERR